MQAAVTPDVTPAGSLCIFIAGQPYSLMVLKPERDSVALIQYRVTKVGGRSYCVSIDADGHAFCDCPDWTYRRHQIDRRGCKHLIAARSVGLLNLTWRTR